MGYYFYVEDSKITCCGNEEITSEKITSYAVDESVYYEGVLNFVVYVWCCALSVYSDRSPSTRKGVGENLPRESSPSINRRVCDRICRVRTEWARLPSAAQYSIPAVSREAELAQRRV